MHVCFRSHPTRFSKICATRPTILTEDEAKAGLESRSEHCYQAGGHYINGRPPQVTSFTTPGTAPLCPRNFGNSERTSSEGCYRDFSWGMNRQNRVLLLPQPSAYRKLLRS